MTKEKVQNDKQRSAKHTYKTKDRVTRTPIKTGDELRYFRLVRSSYSTCGTRHVTLVTNQVISRGWGKDRIVITTNGTYPWSFVTQILQNSEPIHLIWLCICPVGLMVLNEGTNAQFQNLETLDFAIRWYTSRCCHA